MTAQQLLATVPFPAFRNWVVDCFLNDPEIADFYNIENLKKSARKTSSYNELFRALEQVTSPACLAGSYGILMQELEMPYNDLDMYASEFSRESAEIRGFRPHKEF